MDTVYILVMDDRDYDAGSITNLAAFADSAHAEETSAKLNSVISRRFKMPDRNPTATPSEARAARDAWERGTREALEAILLGAGDCDHGHVEFSIQTIEVIRQ
ncbi:hypothetical protein HOT99_gp224 [Caulobacter phage CcrBL10]|uniref:Uncharacterized protein n=1 Tax=Caulobacter phage CcrBL10 TaxID=2283269 RepID=A0A385E9B0_9CAUD|nr:hypothetical protein HOT99_gp224 [Caulobacter phage CcrBL10]AXQ68393.1 hypothetical protein CcrBL10_gp189c [Caulobacter phage CcrBL10]